MNNSAKMKDTEVVFRWTFKHYVTGKTVRGKAHPFPIPLKKEK